MSHRLNKIHENYAIINKVIYRLEVVLSEKLKKLEQYGKLSILS